MNRKLGRSGIEVSAIGLGCWGISGVYWRSETEASGWGEVDDDQSIRAIHRAIDLGITFFDTADVYGTGHSEEVLGHALVGKRDAVTIATKFGRVFDSEKRLIQGSDVSPGHVRRACENSLRRLRTDRIDLYQLHVGDADPGAAEILVEELEKLVEKGRIRYYGWSTDDPKRAALFARGAHCTSIQQHYNVFGGNDETLAVCERENLASINRGPLAQGILTGKFTADTVFDKATVRGGWNLKSGPQAVLLRKFEAIRDVLMSGGRTPAQGALGWLLARSPNMIPIPRFKNEEQVEQNVGALRDGPLSPGQMTEIDTLMAGVG